MSSNSSSESEAGVGESAVMLGLGLDSEVVAVGAATAGGGTDEASAAGLPQCRFRRSFTSWVRTYSSRRCIFSSASVVSVVALMRFRRRVSSCPKTLKRRSHEAELAQTERRRCARIASGRMGLSGLLLPFQMSSGSTAVLCYM